jgi:crossover junction endodeoxyribonuclease RuvC
MIILGIDPGTAITGWGAIKAEKGETNLLDFGTIRTKGELLSNKYLQIFEQMEEILDRLKPDSLSIESQFIYKNPAGAIKISMAKAVIILSATKRGIPVYEYTPLKAKQAVTGSGKADKMAVEKMISLLLNISKKIPIDASDALSLAICHAHFVRFPLNNLV